MKKIYTIILVINEDYEHAQKFSFEDFDEYNSWLMKYTNKHCLKVLGYQYNKSFDNPLMFINITHYKNPTKKEIDYKDYQVMIQLKEI